MVQTKKQRAAAVQSSRYLHRLAAVAREWRIRHPQAHANRSYAIAKRWMRRFYPSR